MRLLGITALITLVLDQASKLYVLFGLDLVNRGAIGVWPPYLNLRMAWNTGINFGLMSGSASRWILIAIAVAIVGFVLIWLRRDPPGRLGYVFGGLLVGGAIGNIVDRVAYGAVADFLNMGCCGIDNPFAFNVADAAIFAGAIGLALWPGQKSR